MTFKPTLVANNDKYLVSQQVRQYDQGRASQLLNDLGEIQERAVTSIKGFDEAVKRMKTVRADQDMLKDRLEKEKRGQRYSKRQLDKIHPPGFLNRAHAPKAGKEILCVEISISPDQ